MTEIEYQEFVRHCPYDAICLLYTSDAADD